VKRRKGNKKEEHQVVFKVSVPKSTKENVKKNEEKIQNDQTTKTTTRGYLNQSE
jgi:hypothetical protein